MLQDSLLVRPPDSERETLNCHAPCLLIEATKALFAAENCFIWNKKPCFSPKTRLRYSILNNLSPIIMILIIIGERLDYQETLKNGESNDGT